MRGRLTAARAAGGLLACALLVTPISAAADPPAIAAPLAADSSEGVIVDLAADSTSLNSADLSAGGRLELSGRIRNQSGQPLELDTVSVSIGAEVATTRAELASMLTAASEPAGAADAPAVAVAVLKAVALSDLTDGAVETFDLAFSERALTDALVLAPAGVHVVTAIVSSGDVTVAVATTTVVLGAGADAPAVAGSRSALTVIAPVTVPPPETGLIEADTLEAYTSPIGLLTRQLNALASTPGTGVAIAIDPMIIASVRALGRTAPASVLEFLQRLKSLPNDIFPLAYADADLALQRRAGADELLGPISFESELNPDDFVAGPDDVDPEEPQDDAPPVDGATESQDQRDSSAAPMPTPSAQPVGIPTTEQLLAWDYSSDALALPVSGTISSADPGFYAESGLSTTIVMSSDLGGSAAASPSAATTSKGDSVLVADSALSRALSDAAYASSDLDWQVAMAEVNALLATTPLTNGETSVLAVLDRVHPASTGRMSQTFAALDQSRQTEVRALASLLEEVPEREVKIAKDAPSKARIRAATDLIEQERAVGDFASVVERPELVTGEQRLRLLSSLSTGWLTDSEDWPESVRATRASFSAVLESISVEESSNINLASAEQDIRVYVTNTLDYPVSVIVKGRPSNGRLLVESQEVTVEPDSSSRIGLPARAVANGRVTLAVSLESPTGVSIGEGSTLDIEIQTAWEAATIWGTLAAVVALFGFGLFRNIRKRRRPENGRSVGGEQP